MSRSGCPAWATPGGTRGGKGLFYFCLVTKKLSTYLASQIESRAAARLLVTSSFSLSSMSRLTATASSSKKIDIVEVGSAWGFDLVTRAQKHLGLQHPVEVANDGGRFGGSVRVKDSKHWCLVRVNRASAGGDFG